VTSSTVRGGRPAGKARAAAGASYARRGQAAGRSGAGRRLLAAFLLIALLAVGVKLAAPLIGGPLRRIALPLGDVSTIRAQAADEHLDPALVAAVIYAESKFHPRVSSAGAIGLMQVMPETAAFIAHRTGGVDFTTRDLASPAINVAYGSWYLRYLLDRYAGAELPALAAYNAGLGKVDSWLARAREEGSSFTVADIPYAATKVYVERVLAAQSAYRATYPRELGSQ
jgi:soluble lytic murein transglycosylase